MAGPFGEPAHEPRAGSGADRDRVGERRESRGHRHRSQLCPLQLPQAGLVGVLVEHPTYAGEVLDRREPRVGDRIGQWLVIGLEGDVDPAVQTAAPQLVQGAEQLVAVPEDRGKPVVPRQLGARLDRSDDVAQHGGPEVEGAPRAAGWAAGGAAASARESAVDGHGSSFVHVVHRSRPGGARSGGSGLPCWHPSR